MRVNLPSLLFCLLSLPVIAHAEPSLFFSEQEMQRIETLVDENPKFNARRRDDILTLDAIFYYGTDNWAVWISGEKWTPEKENPNLQIIEVTPSAVLLKARSLLGTDIETVRLSPHQSYDRVTGEVL